MLHGFTARTAAASTMGLSLTTDHLEACVVGIHLHGFHDFLGNDRERQVLKNIQTLLNGNVAGMVVISLAFHLGEDLLGIATRHPLIGVPFRSYNLRTWPTYVSIVLGSNSCLSRSTVHNISSASKGVCVPA